MKIRNSCTLARLYAGPHHPILATSPELMLINAVCQQNTEAALALFSEKKLFGSVPSAIDAPYGRFEGLGGVRDFTETWLSIFHAQQAFVTPVIQTRANGRAITELVVNFVVDGEINQVPMFVIGELRTKNTLDEVRIYCHHTFVPDLQAYRKPMFTPAYLEMGDPGLLSGSVREYYEALHHVPATDIKRIMASMSPDCKFGGYEPEKTGHEATQTQAEMLEKFEFMASYIPRCVGMRFETITDDNTTCIIEWVHIVSRAGQEERGRIALSGIAAYERGEDGLLCAVRISDYAGYERTIDWSKTPLTEAEAKAINFVEEFPAGVGSKSQTSTAR